MEDLPPVALLDEARNLASQKKRSVYVYRQDATWYIHDCLVEIPSHALILEIKPATASGETHNTGGC